MLCLITRTRGQFNFEQNKASSAKECWSVGKTSQRLLYVVHNSFIFEPFLLLRKQKYWFLIYRRLILAFSSRLFRIRIVLSKCKFRHFSSIFRSRLGQSCQGMLVSESNVVTITSFVNSSFSFKSFLLLT